MATFRVQYTDNTDKKNPQKKVVLVSEEELAYLLHAIREQKEYYALDWVQKAKHGKWIDVTKMYQ